VSERFLGVDGESIHDRYVLFGAGKASLWDRQGLDLVKVLDWLASARRERGTKLVAFSFHYDVSMMVRGYSDEEILRLMRSEPVRFGGWSVRYFPKRVLRAVGSGVRLEIFDVWGFFQCGFEEALQRIGLPVPRVVKWGKAHRAKFSMREAERIELYNRAECLSLQAMCQRLANGMRSQGIGIRSWHGPGALADSVMKKAHLREEMRRPNLGLKDLFARAYFGGRIETLEIGTIKDVDVYDINSAYPEACSMLWDQTRGKWKPARSYTGRDYPVSLWHLEWVLPIETYIGPLPYRRPDGRIYFPRRGRGWYWWPEASLAMRLHPEVQVLEGYVWTGPQSTRLESVVRDLYRRRSALRAQKREVEAHVLKLSMNSLYGKMAQTVGRAPWQAPAWAGYVTAFVRAKLREAVIGCEQNVIAFATDGVFVRGGAHLPVALGEDLGLWKLERGYSGLVLGAGLYHLENPSILDARGRPKVKEGERGGRLPWKKVMEGLNRDGFASVYDTVFVSPLLAILMPDAFGSHRGKFMKRRRVIAPWTDPRAKRYYHYLGIEDWSRDSCDSDILDGWLEESWPFEGDWSISALEALMESPDRI